MISVLSIVRCNLISIFVNTVEDSERNDGSAEKPYFMSKSLMRILGKHNDVSKQHYRD